MKKWLLSLMVTILLLSSCGQPSPAPTNTVVASPAAQPTSTTPPMETNALFEPADCSFELPTGQVEGETVDCGYLVVPENRADPDSRTIRLAVAIFHPPSGTPEPDPIVYLSGGPGGSALEFIEYNFDKVYTPIFAAGRDLILLDQRGVGLSEPALDCPAAQALSLELLDNELNGQILDEDELYALFLESFLECEEDLSAIADLSAYNTVANAADVNDLRLALGYEQVNLWGTSYGTRLALEVMRDYPDGIRSVILDSVYPPDKDLYLDTPANVDRAFTVLFENCAADTACEANFPDLEDVFWDTVAQLDAEPANLEVTNLITGESYPTMLDGSTMIALLFEFLYFTDALPSLPQIIYDAREGHFGLLTLLYGSILAQGEAVSQGMQFSVECHEENIFSTPEEYQTVLTNHPDLAPLFEMAAIGGLGYELCDAWDSGQADARENEPIYSDIPTLIMAGEYDPITPPAWGKHASTTLERSFFFEYPGVGHGASVVAGCPRDMMLAFLNDPATSPDDACISGMTLAFEVPPVSTEVRLEAVSNQDLGIYGLVPVEWEEIAPGVYLRGNSALDVAVLIAQGAPMSAQGLLELLSNQLGAENMPPETGQREANELVWTLYAGEIQGVAVDLAVAESGSFAMIVVLQSALSERDSLYENVFLPVIDSLVPLE